MSVGDVLKKNWKNNLWLLLFAFLVLPMLLSFILVLNFNALLDYDFVKDLLSVSGYFFTLSSLILVFILFKTFKPSDYKRSLANDKFLERALVDLPSKLTIIKNCVDRNETKGLYESCGMVTDVYNSLIVSESDVDLKAYRTEIKKIFNLVNTYKLSRIGFEADVKKLEKMRSANKRQIIFSIDDLLRQLEQRSSLHED